LNHLTCTDRLGNPQTDAIASNPNPKYRFAIIVIDLPRSLEILIIYHLN
jgi:hypothetical protein